MLGVMIGTFRVLRWLISSLAPVIWLPFIDADVVAGILVMGSINVVELDL